MTRQEIGQPMRATAEVAARLIFRGATPDLGRAVAG